MRMQLAICNTYGQKGHVQIFGKRKQQGLKGQDGPGGSVDHERHSTDQSVKDSTPGGGQQEFRGPDCIVGSLGVDGTKGNARSNHRNEEKNRDGNRFGVEIDHLLDPPGSNGLFEVFDDAFSVSVISTVAVTMTILFLGFLDLLP